MIDPTAERGRFGGRDVSWGAMIEDDVVLVIPPHLQGVATSLERSYPVLRLWSDPEPDEAALAKVRGLSWPGSIRSTRR